MEYIYVGKIVNTHGIKGEIRILSNFDLKEEVFKKNVNETLEYTTDPIVSSDIISSTCGATVDGNLTNVIEVSRHQLVHIVAWYDNEMGYSYQMVRTLSEM